jgi:hypothetical protein
VVGENEDGPGIVVDKGETDSLDDVRRSHG